MLNQYAWGLYLNGGGKAVVQMFEDNFTKEFTKEYADEIYKLHRAYCPSEHISSIVKSTIEEAYDLLCEKFILQGDRYTIDTALEELWNAFIEENATETRAAFQFMDDGIVFFSTVLCFELPEAFVPYYFIWNFNVLEDIAREFEIDIPEVPKKKDYKGRFFYYGELCYAFWEFREEHNMTPWEFCAFLYDFAPKYVGGTKYIVDVLPEPKGAYFIGGSKHDAFFNCTDEYITPWQCNPDTRAGDMIVMYLLSPISAVDSVWRSVSIGFNDPFFYYYRCTYISRATPLKRIPLDAMKNDEILGKASIVRKNMQGVNGVELMPSQYNRILELGESNAPRLEYSEIDGDVKITREKDVENLLIKPLLKKLGYAEGDYETQMYIEIGNHNNALIPDFVLLPNKKRGHQSAFALIEAKLSIPTQSFLREVEIQARSYARQLGVKYSAIASKEMFWLYTPDDDYTKPVFHASWAELNDADVFSRLDKFIGKD